ncbi:hypothetical protein D3C75_641680 [compost metagenome]
MKEASENVSISAEKGCSVTTRAARHSGIKRFCCAVEKAENINGIVKANRANPTPCNNVANAKGSTASASSSLKTRNWPKRPCPANCAKVGHPSR